MTIWELFIALGAVYMALRPAIEAGFRPIGIERDEDEL